MNFSPTQEQLEILADAIGAMDAQAMLPVLQHVFAEYESRRQLSRDTHPTAKEALKSYTQIEERLAWIIEELVYLDESMALAGWLGGELDQNGEASMSFAGEVVRLYQVVQRVRQDFEKDKSIPFVLDGEEHHRRTRTRTRDTYLIPALMLVAIQHGDSDGFGWDWRIPAEPDLLDPFFRDFDGVDAMCKFLTQCMSVAGIPAPDAGDMHKGETSQGRLRRMVKDELKRFAEILDNRQIPPLDK